MRDLLEDRFATAMFIAMGLYLLVLLGLGIGITLVYRDVKAGTTVAEDTRAICAMVSEQCYPCQRACSPCEVEP